MKFDIKGIKINVAEINGSISDPGSLTVLCIHGFTGSSRDWQFLTNKIDKAFRILAIDLPGHGASETPENLEFYETDFLVGIIEEIRMALKIEKLCLLGYSMGGRLVYSYASKYRANIIGMIVESAGPGIDDPGKRIERLKHDYLVASKIEKEGIPDFIKFWYSQPVFNTLAGNEALFNKIIEYRINNNPLGLANMLRAFSQGTMPPCYDILPLIEAKVLLLSGSLDQKYLSVNSYVHSLLKAADHIIIKDSGHNIHFEKPEKYIEVLKSFLMNCIKQ